MSLASNPLVLLQMFIFILSHGNKSHLEISRWVEKQLPLIQYVALSFAEFRIYF